MEKYVSFLCVSIYFIVAVNAKIVVNTNSGKVLGKQVASIIENEKYYSFLGIPYADAPLNQLRFMPPKPHPGWDDIFDATKEKKPCAQFYFPMRAEKNHGYCGEEDCLRVSIHTPKIPQDGAKTNLPVIVFFYNELFRWSYNGTKDFGPDFFMKEDVIIVYVNHRLGAHGFLSFEDDLLPGNNGLRDIILSLQWIKENIKYFGGDPDNVTLMGQSEGASLVDMLLYIPKAKGLFHRVMLMSGTAWNSMAFTNNPRAKAIELSDVLEEKATTSSFLLKRLADVSPNKIAEVEHRATPPDEARELQMPVNAFAPIVEHDHPEALITKLPEDTTIDIDVPILIGYNSRQSIEAAEHYLRRPQFLSNFQKDFVFLFPIRVGYKFKMYDDVHTNAFNEMRKRYFEDGKVKVSRPADFLDYENIMMSIYSQDYAVRQYAKASKAPVYYYVFDYSGVLNYRKKLVIKNAISIDGAWGASVGDQLCYLFVCNPIRKTYKKVLAGEYPEELEVLQKAVRLWTNFAKSGNPTPPGAEITWTPASAENKEVLVISEDLEMRSNLHEDEIQFWDEFIEKYRKLAVDGVVADKVEEEF